MMFLFKVLIFYHSVAILPTMSYNELSGSVDQSYFTFNDGVGGSSPSRYNLIVYL